MILNLTEGFEPLGVGTEYFNVSFFSGGEPNVRIRQTDDVVNITIRLKTTNDLMVLCCAVDALRQGGDVPTINLFTPYLPAARQDRVCNKGEALTSKVYADIINNLKLKSVTFIDAHSDVMPALINNGIGISAANFWASLPPIKNVAIPDFGATKKIESVFENKDILIQCYKKRNEDGHLIDFGVYCNDLNGEDVWILDDICDGGGTFMGLAKKLREKNCGKIKLAVTHGIFSKGIGHVLTEIDEIWTTDSWDDYKSQLDTYSNFNVIKLKDII